GIAVEHAEGNRVLVITSCRRVGIAYPDRGGTFQYFPQVEVIGAMSKFSCAVPSVDRLAEIMRKALRIAFEGRPGVVHVDVPESIMNGSFDLDPSWFRAPENYRSLEPVQPSETSIKAAARMLLEAKRPMLHLGSGILHAGASAIAQEVSTLLQAPITTSWAARATVDERNPTVIPMTFLDAVNDTRRQADLVLALGSRIGESDWWGKPPYWGKVGEQRWIQVDIDAEHLGNIRPVELAVRGDVKLFLERLASELRRQGIESRDLSKRRAFVREMRNACDERRKTLDEHLEHRGVPMHPAHVATICQKVFDDDAILVIDGGNTAIWAHFFHEVRTPNTIITTPKMGMLGAGVSQAVAAKAAHPDKQVYCIIGDGAMGFHSQEIETAIRNGLHVTYLVLADKQWGMVKMNQQFMLKPIKTLVFKALGPDETINADLCEIEWDALARAMGGYGERVADPDGLEGALRRCLAAERCSVIHVDVDPVKHMWAPELLAFKAMHEEPQG
ncbi:MAG: thiamine pyrophosphate-binding protein, partial [Myxococcales bacterium]|nr:thiamine pyrophosphate-binding protein [Myxococcales bacterium]